VSQDEFDRRLARIRTINRELRVWCERVASPRIRELGASFIRKRLAEAMRPLIMETVGRE
jgi:hypothetical protein